ncbi:MAG: CPBP family intramembrane metalloprotease [Lachnospiraceae bacterium]|nr:CPBP family intramembrane metalloprotease [Lachnospiraceae bacterium]
MGEIFGLITPLLLHMMVSELAVALLGSYLDPAACTTIASLLVIPAAFMMYRKDCGRISSEAGRRQSKRGFLQGEQTECSKGRLLCFGVFCFIAGGVLNILWSGLLNAMHIPDYFSNQTQEALLAGEMLLQVIGLGILVPVAEELVFRGLIYKRMKRFFSVRISVLLSAALFAVYHGNPIQMIFAFPMAIALAAVFEHGKLFIFPVLFHMGANLTAVFLNFL